MGIIYSFTNLINGKKYIGQTINPNQRYAAHKSAISNINSSEFDSPLHRAFRKYGFENFEYEVLTETESIDELNALEAYYIAYYNTQVPNGYNIKAGGNNASFKMKEETKEKLRKIHAVLSEEEVIALRKAYANHESPSKIFNEKYKGKMHYNSFLNIWCGSRYGYIMPEVFTEKNRRKTTDEETVRKIKIDRQNGLTYKQLREKYGLGRGCIEGICSGKTWKHVQI